LTLGEASIELAVASIDERFRPGMRNCLLSTHKSLLEQGIIEYSTSPWAAPVVLLLKKDGTLRLCIDFRRLNDITLNDSFPLPRIDETLDKSCGAKYFTTLDMESGY
jgi:hypothetical protein